MFKYIILTFLFLALLLFQTSSVKIKHKLKNHIQRSNDKQYLPTLNQTQNQLTQDLTLLKQQMDTLNKNLENALTDEAKKAILTQGLADQRDIIFKIDSYLSIPYEQRQCHCQPITTKQKQQLINQTKVVQQSINSIQQTINQCQNCNLISQLQKQLNLQKKYLQIINDTISGRCCQDQYSICEEGLIFNQLTKKCQVNINHPPNGNYIVIQTNGTNIIGQLGPQCPLKKPIYNSQTQQCQKCPISTPYWNTKIKQCQKCQDNTFYSQQLQTCWKTCLQKYQKYNYEKRQCETSLSVSSICPHESPIWDNESLYCRRCPHQSPFWNIATKQCESCPQNTYWRDQLSYCVEKCKQGYILNEKNGQCQGICLNIQKPAWNGFKNECVACPQAAPRWDSEAQQCVSCPAQTPIWNLPSQKCEQKKKQQPQANGTVLVRNSNISTCLIGMIFDEQKLRCHCVNQRVYDYHLKDCVPCPGGQHFDQNSQKCIANSNNNVGKQTNETISSQENGCQQGYHYSIGFSKCIQICDSDEIFDLESDKCKKICSQEFIYNIATKQCEKKSFYCPKGAYYDQSAHKCLSCPPGFIYIESTGKCRFICQDGQSFSVETGKCI